MRTDEQREYDRVWYAKQSNEYKTQRRAKITARRNALKNKAREYKTNRGCVRCKESDSVCLDFHHKGDKEIEISRAQQKAWSWKRLLKEIEKCVVICSNCHRKLHAGRFKLD